MIEIVAIEGMPEIGPGDEIAALICDRAELCHHDIVVVTQKIVSKAEGRIVGPDQVEPSAFARAIAAQGLKDAAYYEVVLRESRRIVKMDRGVLVAETHHGLMFSSQWT